MNPEGVGRRDDFPTAGGRVTLERGCRVIGPDGTTKRFFRDLSTASAYTASTSGWGDQPIERLASIAAQGGGS